MRLAAEAAREAEEERKRQRIASVQEALLTSFCEGNIDGALGVNAVLGSWLSAGRRENQTTIPSFPS